jgi:hypothetical protein
MGFFKSVIVVFIAVALVTGCAIRHLERDTLKNQVNVFGVQLHSDTDYREINGIKGVDEPCLKGYERSFDALDIVIGYGFDGKVRKITTRNPATSLFGVSPGMTYEEGKRIIPHYGFAEHGQPFTFRSNGYVFTFLVDDTERVFGLKLETFD